MARSEPAGRPVLSGPQRSSSADAEWALTKARRYVFAGGGWTPSLHDYVDAWLGVLTPDETRTTEQEETHD